MLSMFLLIMYMSQTIPITLFSSAQIPKMFMKSKMFHLNSVKCSYNYSLEKIDKGNIKLNKIDFSKCFVFVYFLFSSK